METKEAKVARKLRCTAKIARSRENVKMAQKLRCTRSQFSGGTKQGYQILFQFDDPG